MLPLIIVDENFNNEVNTVLPSKTYYMDFDTGEIHARYINEEDAIKQAAIKAIKTIRDNYLIYSTDYGSELFYLIGKSYSLEYLKIEVPRLIREALSVDDRIEECTNFVIKKIGDILEVSFDIVTDNELTIVVEVELNV